LICLLLGPRGSELIMALPNDLQLIDALKQNRRAKDEEPIPAIIEPADCAR
jgi:hypothetical protein